MFSYLKTSWSARRCPWNSKTLRNFELWKKIYFSAMLPPGYHAFLAVWLGLGKIPLTNGKNRSFLNHWRNSDELFLKKIKGWKRTWFFKTESSFFLLLNALNCKKRVSMFLMSSFVFTTLIAENRSRYLWILIIKIWFLSSLKGSYSE